MPQDWLGHQCDRHFIVLRHQYGYPDVMMMMMMMILYVRAGVIIRDEVRNRAPFLVLGLAP